MSARLLLSLAEAAESVGLSQDYVRRALKSDGSPGSPPPLPAKKLAGAYKIRPAVLDDWTDRLEDA